MHLTWIICRRELASYFATPLAYVFLVIFLLLGGISTFYLGGWYERNQADLQPFFDYHPLLYLVLIPAVSMRLWAEERRSGTLELLLTLPISLRTAVLGKFLAAWGFIALALTLTFPLWITVNWLGNPDNGAILAAYLGSLLMAGSYLAIGECLSAATQNQVVAFVLTLVTCLLFIAAGSPIVLDPFQRWAPGWWVDGIASLSFLTHFRDISRGVLNGRDILFFLILICGWLWACSVVIENKKSG